MKGTVARLLFAMGALLSLMATPQMAVASGATTELAVIRYAIDGVTILAETTVSYEWLEENLPVYGDGVTHYYHQGPVFEGDMWDPSETVNLKDKGAVKGTAVRDLCELVGGMRPGEQVSLVAVDGWHTEFAYENVYEPLDLQGPIVLAWFNGAEPASGEKYGTGYPGLGGYHTAMQIVFMPGTTNEAGQHVFGNDDMRISLPQEEYQHYYQGLPSTNGLSGKWISKVVIYSQQKAPSGEVSVQAGDAVSAPIALGPTVGQDVAPSGLAGLLSPALWLILALGGIGLVFLTIAFVRLRRGAN
jgi:hypothetical protein